MNVTPNDRSLSVVGSGTIQVDMCHFNDVLSVPSLSCNLVKNQTSI